MMKLGRSVSISWKRQWHLLVFAVAWGCGGGDDGHPTTYQYDATTNKEQTPDRCATPNQGCACPTPGEIVDCGKIIVKIDDYETCYEGSRLCQADATWGACEADQTIVQLTQ